MGLDIVASTWRRVRAQAEYDVRKSAPTAREQAFNIALLLFMLAVASLRQGHYQTPGGVLIAFTFLAWAPLLLRTRRPLGVLLAVVVIEGLHLAMWPALAPHLDRPVAIASYQPVPLATMAAVWTVITRTPRLLGWVTSIAAAVALLVGALTFQPGRLIGTDMMMFDLVLITAGIATVVASQRDRMTRAEQEQARLRDLAVIDERLRIARELHDVLAHNLTLVNAQAGVAEYLLASDPDAAATALRGISSHTTRAIEELRVTIGLLRQEPAAESGAHSDGAPTPAGDQELRPMPSLAGLAELIGTFETSGTQVRVTTNGEPLPLDEHTDLAAYRIIQEALTNATKHGDGSSVTVDLRWSSSDLTVTIVNATPLPTHATRHAPNRDSGRTSGAHRTREPNGTGNGLIGMRERAHSAGGTFTAGPRDHTFQVQATIPTSTSRSPSHAAQGATAATASRAPR